MRTRRRWWMAVGGFGVVLMVGVALAATRFSGSSNDPLPEPGVTRTTAGMSAVFTVTPATGQSGPRAALGTGEGH